MDPPSLEELLHGNAAFVRQDWSPDDKSLDGKPRLRLAVVACMDTRFNVERVLGLQHGDAKIIRNAGNIIDDGTLRSLIVAVHLMDVQEVAILGHTKCGMTRVGRGDFAVAHSIADRTGVPLGEVMRPDFQRWLGGFDDPASHLRRSVDLLRGHPYFPKDMTVFGLLYDNDTGKVSPIE